MFAYMVSPSHGEAPECETCHQRGDGPLLDEAHGAARRHHRAERVAEVVSGHPGLCLSGNKRRTFLISIID